MVENYDKTHMVLDLEDGRVLDFQEKANVTHADVSSGRNCFTVAMRISSRDGGRI